MQVAMNVNFHKTFGAQLHQTSNQDGTMAFVYGLRLFKTTWAFACFNVTHIMCIEQRNVRVERVCVRNILKHHVRHPL